MRYECISHIFIHPFECVFIYLQWYFCFVPSAKKPYNFITKSNFQLKNNYLNGRRDSETCVLCSNSSRKHRLRNWRIEQIQSIGIMKLWIQASYTKKWKKNPTTNSTLLMGNVNGTIYVIKSNAMCFCSLFTVLITVQWGTCSIDRLFALPNQQLHLQLKVDSKHTCWLYYFFSLHINVD